MRKSANLLSIADFIVFGSMILFYPVFFITCLIIRFITFVYTIISIFLNILKYEKHHWFIFRSLFIQYFSKNTNKEPEKFNKHHRYYRSFNIIESKVNILFIIHEHDDFYNTYKKIFPKDICTISENGVARKSHSIISKYNNKKDIYQLYRLIFLIVVIDHLFNLKKYCYDSNILDFVYFNIDILEENKSLSSVFEDEFKRKILLKSL